MNASTEQLLDLLVQPMLRLAWKLRKNKADRHEAYRQLEELADELTQPLSPSQHRDLLNGTITFTVLRIACRKRDARRRKRAMEKFLSEAMKVQTVHFKI